MGESETKSTEREPEKGLECRSCGGRRFEVTHTRRVIDAILRRRRCLQCGQRLTTRERELYSQEKRHG